MRIWISASVLLGLISAGQAENWPHWRGPTGNGVGSGAPPVEWSMTKNVRWKVPLPRRENSSPIVWDQQVFITTTALAEGGANESPPRLAFQLRSYDRRNGELLWEQTSTTAQPHEGTHNTNGFASASPCTDGEHVYAPYGSRGIYCYTLDGKFVWKRDDFGPMKTLNAFGEGSSPTLVDDLILVPWDHIGPSALYALNKRTGETVWKASRAGPTCWSTPLVVEYEGAKQVIMNGQNRASAYDLATGEELWHCAGQTRRPVASPVAGNGLIYVASGFQGAFIGAFRPDGRGDIKDTSHVAWTINHDAPDIASPLLSSGRLYFFKGKSGLFSCVDAVTGQPHYFGQRIDGLDTVYASPIAANGHVYLTGLSGTTVVIKDSPQFEIVATNTLDEILGATPATVDGALFLRGDKHLYCIAEEK
ncbi:MAG: PQQ-binding-like beta-propeller repeat protein [Planctomycetaceae bacterium]